jgi:hypothetical protein
MRADEKCHGAVSGHWLRHAVPSRFSDALWAMIAIWSLDARTLWRMGSK